MNWYATKRYEWIGEMLRVYGYINRKHLVRHFGISVPQASADLQNFALRCPALLRYDLSKKCYVSTTTERI